MIKSEQQIEILKKMGEAAFGASWKANLADALPVARPTITDWIKGEKPIPVGIWSNILKILHQRHESISEALSALSSQHHLVIASEMLRKGRVVIADEYSEYLNSLSSQEITDLQAKYKQEYICCSKIEPDCSFADLAVINDAIHFQIVIRNINGNLDLTIAEDCAISYHRNLKLAKSFGLDEDFMINRTKEIFGAEGVSDAST